MMYITLFSVTLLKEFFDARLQIEEKVESMWTTFYMKWQKKFEEVEDPLKLSSTEESLSDKMRLLVEETRDNSIICCSVKSLLQRKRQNPSNVLERWLTNPMDGTGCVDIEEFKDYYITAVNTMANCEKEADKSFQALLEKIIGLQNLVAEWSLVPMSDLNGRIAQGRKVDEQEREVDRAKDSYEDAVYLHKHTSPIYIETMADLRKCLDSYEKNRLATMQQATKLYLGAINQYETQRASRKQRVEELLMYFNSIEVNKTVEQCFSSLKEPCDLSEYLDVHEVLASNNHVSRKIEVQPQMHSPPELHIDSGHEQVSTPEQEDVKCQMSIDVTEDIELDGESTDTDKMFKSSIEDVNGATTPIEPGPRIETPVPLLKETQAFEKEPEIVKIESETSQDVGVTDVAAAAHVKVYAMDNYESLLPGHLTFHTGQKIKQKRAANEDGLAFGYILTNKYTRYKTYGLYPVRLVTLKVPSKKRTNKKFFRKK